MIQRSGAGLLGWSWETDCGYMIERFVEPPSKSGVFLCLECGRKIAEYPETESDTPGEPK